MTNSLAVRTKKAEKVKESISLSPEATVDSINLNPNDPAVRAAKEADKKNDAALALAAHTQLEEKAAAFASEFRAINQQADEAEKQVVSSVQTAKSFINANRDFLNKVTDFFAKNRGRKVKQTLGGCLTFEDYSRVHLGVKDDYVRQVFRATDNSFKFADGTKLLSAKEEGGDEDEDENLPAQVPQVPPVKFANQLQMSTLKAINESSYSQEDKMKITRILLRALTTYAEGLRHSLTAEPEAPAEAAQAGAL
jgi:hypothetical protein